MVDELKPIHPVAPRPRWPFTRRQIVAQIIVAGVILASGIAIGIGGTILSLKDRIIRFPPPGGRPWMPDANELIDRWRTDLSLTDEQARQIKDIFTKSLEATRERWILIANSQQKEREEFAASMRGILTPGQFQKWEDEFKERERHFRQWRPGGPGGPDRMGRPDRQGGPSRPGGPDGHRDRGFRGMRGPESPPDGPPPDSPRPDSPPPQ